MAKPSDRSPERKLQVVLSVLRDELATGARTGVLRILRPSTRKISSKLPMNWLARFPKSARVWMNQP